MINKENAHKIYLLASCAIIGYAITAGLFRGGSFRPHALRTFTYQSNIFFVIGFLCMVLLYKNHEKLRNYIFISVLMAITVTGLVYNFVLVPFARAPVVFSDFENFATHALSTILALINYFLFETKGKVNIRCVLASMVFPALYWVVFVSIGGIIDFYPYFFMNPNIVGWPMVFVWFGVLLTVFALLGFLLILYDKKQRK